MMQNKIKQSLFLAWISSLTLIFTQPVFADNGFILKKGKEYPICREMLKIMNLPQNAHTIGYRTTSKELAIPKNYKNFEMVEWKPLIYEEAEKYITPETFHVLELVKERALTIEKDWDGKGDFEFAMAQVDLAGNGKQEIMLRYRLPNWKKWNCMLADSEPESYRMKYNPRLIKDSNGIEYGVEGLGQQCITFKYGGKIYTTFSFGASGFDVGTIKGGKIGDHVYKETICDIANPNWKKEPEGVLK